MFGAVTSKDIATSLEQKGLEIDKKKIYLDAPIKKVVYHKALIRLHDSVSFDLHFDVVSENPIS
jgi:large subunit ribosomal protein L9